MQANSFWFFKVQLVCTPCGYEACSQTQTNCTVLCRWSWIGTTVVVQNLTGGDLAWVMVTFSFIADNSADRERVIRLGFITFCYTVRSSPAMFMGHIIKSPSAKFLHLTFYYTLKSPF
jgi:hypothetical protein